MPSPFPGMDPYLENPDLWPDVHHALISAIQRQLTLTLGPLPYVARVELRTFMFDPDDPASELYVIPDARIVEHNVRRGQVGPPPGAAGGPALAVAAPIAVTGLAATG